MRHAASVTNALMDDIGGVMILYGILFYTIYRGVKAIRAHRARMAAAS